MVSLVLSFQHNATYIVRDKGKVKLSLYLAKHRTVKAYWGVEV
jgi:hypothetical protein